MRAATVEPRPITIRARESITVRFPPTLGDYWHSPQLTKRGAVQLTRVIPCRQGALVLTVHARHPGGTRLNVLFEPTDPTVQPDPGPGFEWSLHIRVTRR